MRLIDANAMIREIWEMTVQPEWCKTLTETIIRNQPTVDAVPVIRCRDCKHGTPCRFYESTWYVCTRNNVGIDMNADDYCSRAERKDEKSCG